MTHEGFSEPKCHISDKLPFVRVGVLNNDFNFSDFSLGILLPEVPLIGGLTKLKGLKN